jgi:glycyl-tRNA synthetase beta chain
MAELLLELLSEEIPARMQARAAEELKRIVIEKLTAARLEHSRLATFVTPRRLALVADGLPSRQPDLTEERKGPRVGAPEQAIQGFLKAAGLQSLERCEVRKIGNAEFYFATRAVAGRDTRQLLPEIILAAIGELPWPKSMRWGAGSFRYVRPLHCILALFDGKPLEGSLDLGDRTIAFGDRSRGHRFLAPEAFAVTGGNDYKKKLRAAYVIVEREERKRIIREGAERLALGAGLVLKDNPGLLEEVTGLVEWPVLLIGAIDDAFMDVPREVLTATMRANQKYFSLETKEGRLAPRFILVANIETKDGGKAIVAGNERVLRARLADAKFFWDQDRKTRLEERVPRLKELVFHAKLGSVYDKVERLKTLAAKLVEYVQTFTLVPKEKILRAAWLCKADLVSGMVGEFPEVQGVMGGYYALHDGEDAEVADAIREHYSPLGPNDRCPTAPISVAVALADKIDTLVGFFGIREWPTGSKDPYALRRAALGVIRIIMEGNLRLHLLDIFQAAIQLYNGQLVTKFKTGSATNRPLDGLASDTATTLLAFFGERLKAHLREDGVRHDLVSAVFARPEADDLEPLRSRIQALQEFLQGEDGPNLLTAYKRAANIVRIEEKKDGTSYSDGPLEIRPEHAPQNAAPEEQELQQALSSLRHKIAEAIRAEDFAGAMSMLASLRKPVDAFFDKVTVNVAEPALRANRLALLAGITAVMNLVADFSKIEG